MERTYWYKQEPGLPLFPDLLWSRPENRHQAGKLLIIGGNLYGFSAPASAYQTSLDAGIGTTKVLLPNALQKTLGQHLETAEFAVSTPSGSFGQAALGEFLDLSNWADAVLMAGDMGRNSETAIVFEQFAQKYKGQLTLTKDAVDYTYNIASIILNRPETLLVLSQAQLQKLARAIKTPQAVTFSMDLLQLVDFLHEFTRQFPVAVMAKHLENLFVATKGKVSTTKLSEEKSVWRVDTAASASVWWLQNPSRSFEALTTSVGIVL